MSTDITMALLHKAHVEAQVLKSSLTIVCLWTAVGLVLTGLMIRFGFGSDIATVLAAAG